MLPHSTTPGATEVVAQLTLLRAQAGSPSFGEIARRVGHLREQRGQPHTRPGRTTVYDLFRPGRSRVDPDLLRDAALALGASEDEAADLVAASGSSTERTSPADVARAHPGLPAGPTPSFGRDDEVAALLTVLSSGTRAVAITGLGGIGKTHVASRLAEKLLVDGFVESVLTVDMRGHDAELPPCSPSAAARAVLATLADAHGTVESRPIASFHQVLASRPVCVVLDDAHGVEQVAPLLPTTAGRALVVVTTRTRIEHPALASVSLFPLRASATEGLLAHLVGHDRLGQDESAARELAEMTGGLPLAAELLAGRIRSHGDWAIADLAEQQRRLRSVLRLEEPLSSAVAAAYDGCSGAARHLLRAFASQPCSTLDMGAAARVAGQAPAPAMEATGELDRAHLVGTEAGRLSLHDVVRTFALALAETEDAPSARLAAIDRLCDHMLGHLAACVGVLGLERESFGGSAAGTMSLIEPTPGDRISAETWLVDNLPSLLELVAACVEQRPHVVWRAASDLVPWLHATWRLGDAAWLLDLSRQAAVRHGDRRLLAEISLARGTAVTWTSAPREALSDLAFAERAFRELDDPEKRQAVLGAQSLSNRYAGELATAAEQALEVLEGLPPGHPERVHRWWTAINCLTMLGQHVEARRLESSILPVDVAAGDPAVFNAFYRTEDLLLRQCWEEAEREATRGMMLADAQEPPGSTSGTARAYGAVVLAGARAHTGHAGAAAESLRASVRDAQGSGDRQLELYARTLLGEALLEAGMADRSLVELESATALALELSNPVAEACILEVAAASHHAAGHHEDASRCRSAAEELSRVMGSTPHPRRPQGAHTV